MTDTPKINFTDGAGYERMMGKWSRLVGEEFLDWLAPPDGKAWLDVGCGNGAFTEMILRRSAPSRLDGVDPSEGQATFARTRLGDKATITMGSAMELPYPDGSFDQVTSALVIFFMPDPAKGVREMVRVARPGATISTYAWDFPGGGFPLHPIQEAMRAMGMTPTLPPHPEAARLDALETLWDDAGVSDVETKTFTVTREFENFEDFWGSALLSPGLGTVIAQLPPETLARLKTDTAARMPTGTPFRPTAWANAVKGRLG